MHRVATSSGSPECGWKRGTGSGITYEIGGMKIIALPNLHPHGRSFCSYKSLGFQHVSTSNRCRALNDSIQSIKIPCVFYPFQQARNSGSGPGGRSFEPFRSIPTACLPLWRSGGINDLTTRFRCFSAFPRPFSSTLGAFCGAAELGCPVAEG